MDRSKPLTRRPAAGSGPLRVLFVISSLEPGGSEGQLTSLVLHAHPQRIRATIATLYPTHSEQHARRLAGAGVGVQALTGGRDHGRPPALAVAMARLGRLVRTLAPDVVYAWLEEAAIVSVPVARALRVPVVVARRNVSGSALEHYPPVRLAIRRNEAAATLVTANSDSVRRDAIARGIPAARIRVVLNGHRALAPLAHPPAPPVRLGYLAHLRAEKGHFRLLDALGRLSSGLDWRADLAGTGPLEGELRREIARAGLGQRVSLLGPVSDPREFWVTRHVAVLLSDHEGLSNALIEAAMAGRPLLATAVGGNPDVVGAGSGLLVPSGDGAAIAAAIERMVTDRDLRAQLGAEAHRQAVDRFSMERFVDGHVTALVGSADRGSLRNAHVDPRSG